MDPARVIRTETQPGPLALTALAELYHVPEMVVAFSARHAARGLAARHDLAERPGGPIDLVVVRAVRKHDELVDVGCVPGPAN